MMATLADDVGLQDQEQAPRATHVRGCGVSVTGDTELAELAGFCA
jgi:hypothetical protein